MIKGEWIRFSAILHDGQVYSLPRPARHWNIRDVILEKTGIQRLPADHPEGSPQGFITSTGRFVNREEGAKIALESEQIHSLKWPPDLYSEDIYDIDEKMMDKFEEHYLHYLSNIEGNGLSRKGLARFRKSEGLWFDPEDWSRILQILEGSNKS